MLYQLISKSLELEEERKWGSLIDNPRYNTYKHIFGASQPKKNHFSFPKRILNSTGMHDIGQLARNSSPIFAQSGKSSFMQPEILPNVKRVLTVCKSSAGDSGKKARRLIAEAPEMPFHTALISRGVIFSFSRKSWKRSRSVSSSDYLQKNISRYLQQDKEPLYLNSPSAHLPLWTHFRQCRTDTCHDTCRNRHLQY